MREKKFSKETIRRQRIDRERTLRVVKYIDYPFVLTDCPVELEEGYIVTDRISCDVFASFVFKNVSEMLIKRLDIRLACYQNQNIPYLNIDFTYSQDELTFGVISKNGKDMKPDLYEVPPEIDETVARLKLESAGIFIDNLSDDQIEYLKKF